MIQHCHPQRMRDFSAALGFVRRSLADQFMLVSDSQNGRFLDHAITQQQLQYALGVETVGQVHAATLPRPPSAR